MVNLRNKNGYALFLTLLVIVIFGILSVSLISILQSGNKRAYTREHHTQASELSEKGLQHIVNKINSELKTALGIEGLSRSEFTEQLEVILNKYKCDLDGNLVSSNLETGSYNVCISEYSNVTNDTGEINELRKRVTFKSLGNSSNQTKDTEYVVDIGADTVPDALKYALSTVGPDGHQTRPSDGNIYLHGGIEIYGDIKAGNHLFTHDHGPGLSSGSLASYANWRETTLPSLFSSSGKGNAKIVLRGNLFRFDNSFYNLSTIRNNRNITRQTYQSYYNNHLDWSNRNTNYKRSTINNMFSNKENPPKIVKRDWSGNNVSIEENINEAKNKINHTKTNKGTSIINFQSNEVISFTSDRNKTFSLHNAFKSGRIEQGNRTTFLRGNHEFDSLYINGNVTIGNSSTSNFNRNYDNITIGGYTKDRGAQLFVNGNVTIQGANLTSNLTIYTTGTVTVRYTTIKGKKFSNNSEGALIVFSKGKVQLANNSLYRHDASELKGFFYSEEALEMFGVGSKIKIHGGIAARRITLNAIRGNYQNQTSGWGNALNPTSLSSPSRLVIQYDTELIENYLKLNPPEPVIKEVDSSELKDRK